MLTRPKIKLALSPFDKAMEFGGILFLLFIWGLTLYTFLKLPAIIPIHFNASGEPDNYGNKATLFILPALGTVLYIGLTQLNKYPHIFNYMVDITEDNAEKQYTLATRMLRFYKLATLLVFSVIVLFTYLTTIGVTKGLGFWFLPLISVLFLGPLIVVVRQSLKKKDNMG